MSISFHCNHCNRKIEAPDSAGGKWGVCPACKNKVYIPDLTADVDLKLAPVDEKEEARKQRLMAETFELSQEILEQREADEGGAKEHSPAPSLTEEQLRERIINYLRNMADGNLETAKQLAGSITAAGADTVEILDQIALSDMPEPELQDVPPQVVAAFIRELRSKIM